MTTAQFPKEADSEGNFVRQEDEFRDWVDAPADFGRYHLYVSLACPWAHRTLIARTLMCLQDSVSLGVVDPVRDERGWAFREGDGHGPDKLNGFRFLSEAYRASDPGFSGRVTVPVLWDKKERRVVNNSEDDICRMFQTRFGSKASGDWFPADLEKEQEELSRTLYETVNNGVYRAGFATHQKAYEKAFDRLFEALGTLNERLSTRRYLFGQRIVESDWRLFCTLVRFDAVYHGHFKCNLRRITDYTHLQGYLRDLYQLPGIRETVDLDHIKRHYYITHPQINPTGIVPKGPLLDLESPHGRDRLC